MKKAKKMDKQSEMIKEQKLINLDKVKFKLVSSKLLQSAPVTMQIAYES